MKKNRHAKEEVIMDKVFTVKLTTEELKRIDKYAKRMRLNRSQLVRNLVNVGMDDLDLMNSTGFLTMTLKGVDILDKIKEALGEKKYEVSDGKLVIEL